MATHTQLPIYKAAYSLLDVVMDLVKNIPRDFKRLIGEEIAKESSAIMILVFRANVAQDKEPYLLKLLDEKPSEQRYNAQPVVTHQTFLKRPIVTSDFFANQNTATTTGLGWPMHCVVEAKRSRAI